MVNSEHFAKRLQKIMDEYDLTAAAFADKIEVGRSSISHILSGRNKPSLEFVMKVIDTFEDVELYWLLNGKGSFPKEIKNSKESTIQSSPSLFQEETVIKSTSQTITQPNTNNAFKTIARIVIFYDDGTFENFRP